jgi:2-dehydropantoate 2-reductase
MKKNCKINAGESSSFADNVSDTSPEETEWNRVHIFADDVKGLFMAQALQQLPDKPPITLVFPQASQWSKWQEEKQIHVSYETATQPIVQTYQNFEYELSRPYFRKHGRFMSKEEFMENDTKTHWERREPGPPLPSDPPPPDFWNKKPIKFLIVASHPQAIVARLLSLRHRLSPDSTVLLVYDGLGVYERIAKEVFPEAEFRPNFIQGVSTHGIYSENHQNQRFGIFVKKEGGTLTVSPLPKFHKTLFEEEPLKNHNETSPPDTVAYFLSALKRCPDLLTTEASVSEVFMMQLETVLVQSIIAPLSIMADCRIGQLLYTHHFVRSMRLLLTELCIVVRALPELASYPNRNTRFSPERLEKLVVQECFANRAYYHPMVVEMRNGGPWVNVNHLSGWIVQRGEDMGVKCWMNYLTMNLVLGKKNITTREIRAGTPFAMEEIGENISHRERVNWDDGDRDLV